jgi:hypothetical protein
MPSAYDFKLAPTRVIEPTGGPGAELVTLEDAAPFVGLMRLAAELLLKAIRSDRTNPQKAGRSSQFLNAAVQTSW